MAKKKKIIDLKAQNISYKQDNLTYKVLFLKTSTMTVELSVYNDNVFIEDRTLPFAHLPKNIKQQVKPV